MNREELKKLVDEGLSSRTIASRTGLSQSSIRYWISKYELKLMRGPKGKLSLQEFPYSCSCGETNPDKFYGRKRFVCGKCHNEYTIQRGKETKERIVGYLGGKCVACGFDNYICSLDVHHIDPSKKDINFKSKRGWCWERIVKELENCILLCKNCHQAYHNGFDIGL